MTLKGVTKFKAKLTCDLKNDVRNLVNFRASSRKSENWHFDWIALSKAYKDLDEKLQKSYVSWHWRVRQGLQKNSFFVSKRTWGIWWILMRAVASLKFFTLTCYFYQCHTKFRRIISHNSQKRSKLWRKTDFWFKKWHEEFGEL